MSALQEVGKVFCPEVSQYALIRPYPTGPTGLPATVLGAAGRAMEEDVRRVLETRKLDRREGDVFCSL